MYIKISGVTSHKHNEQSLHTHNNGRWLINDYVAYFGVDLFTNHDITLNNNE